LNWSAAQEDEVSQLSSSHDQEVAIGISSLRLARRDHTSLHRIGTSIDRIRNNQASDHEWPHRFGYTSDC
jgi:hypothetical protein